MAFNFKQAAQEKTVLSEVMAGRKKLATDDVVGKEFTIVEFGFAPKFDKAGNPIIDPDTGEADVFGVVIFKEAEDCYYSVGNIFTKVCKAWADEFDGDTVTASEELRKSGGVRVRFSLSKTKAGNNLTAVEILD